MSEPTIQRKTRNRISLILQLATPNKAPEGTHPSSKAKNASSPTAGPPPSSSSVPSPRQSTVNGMASASSSSHGHIPISPTEPSLVTSPDSIAPPTTNELGAQEKRRLLKRTRKLSQIFGEMPSVVPEEHGVFGRHPSNAHERPSRNSGYSPPSRSVLPSLQIPVLEERATPFLSPMSEVVSPLTFAAPGPPLPGEASLLDTLDSSPSAKVDHAPPTKGHHGEREGRRSTTTNSRRAPNNNRERRGGFKSPKLEEQSPSPLSARSPFDSATSPTRSQSARRALSKAKWQSVDADALPSASSWNSRPNTASDSQKPTTSSSAHTTAGERSLRRTRSLWSRKAGQKLGNIDAPEQDRATVIKDLKENGPFAHQQRPMSRQQRSASVRKARKLNQVFGSEPPQALYISAVVDVPSGNEHQRDSIATLLSISSTELLSVRSAKHRSISSISMSSVSSEPSSVSHGHLPSESTKGAIPPSTPPPFSNVAHSDTSIAEPHKSIEMDPDTFRQRRMRAAKLSRFFGVDPRDISQSLVTFNPAPTQPLDTSTRPSFAESRDVDVRIQEPGLKFWSRPDDRQINGAHPDMNDVISRLRQMR